VTASKLAIPVKCSQCGKTLVGRPNLAGRFNVSRHNAAPGLRCSGHLFTDHHRIGESR
jgi:hypothetical protein